MKVTSLQLTWSVKLWTCGSVGGKTARYAALAHIASYLTIPGREEGRTKERERGKQRETRKKRRKVGREKGEKLKEKSKKGIVDREGGRREEGRERGDVLYPYVKASLLHCHVSAAAYPRDCT